VNLRVIEKEDLPFLAEWINNPAFFGEYNPLLQQSKKDLEKHYDERPSEENWFFVEKKDSDRIGFLSHFSRGGLLEIGFTLVPSERGKGYCTEAVKIMLDYLFLSKNNVSIQASTDARNVAAQKVLEKVGFSKEGTIRKASFSRGNWRNMLLYSILREDWKEPKILTKANS